MEIRDYLRAIRRILWLVIAVPVIAGLLVGGFIELQPSAYQANATAVVPAITANGISQSAASQYASTFKDVLVSQSIIPVVSQKYGIPQSELVTGLSSSTATDPSNVMNAIITKTKQTLAQLGLALQQYQPLANAQAAAIAANDHAVSAQVAAQA